MKVFYVGLEPYNARYTLQLSEWTRRAFSRRGIEADFVEGTALDQSEQLKVGQVLDAHNRCFYAMSQMMGLALRMRQGEVTSEDVIWFEDMFHPGIESLGYIMNQVPAEQQPRVFVRCLAQSIDPDDFIHVCGMANWMSVYEQMVVRMPNVTVLATSEEMVAHARIAGWNSPIYNVAGLPFSTEEVHQRIGGKHRVTPFCERKRRVVFAARFDQEKQPGFFMDLVEAYRAVDKSVSFAVVSGGPLRSNRPEFVSRAKALEARGDLEIHDDLPKNDYYGILNDSRVLFNCALQDWVSFTASEGDALGCNLLYPAYRSFPETFANDPDRLFVPWSQQDAIAKLRPLIEEPHPRRGAISQWNDQTIDRIIDIIEGDGEQWRREGVRYRDHVSPAKYA